jgi:hypothetical protein
MFTLDVELMELLKDHDSILGTTKVPIFIWDTLNKKVGTTNTSPDNTKVYQCEYKGFKDIKELLFFLVINKVVILSLYKPNKNEDTIMMTCGIIYDKRRQK